MTTVARNPRPIPILTYHQLDTPPPKGTPYRGLTVAPATFSRHMRLLKAMGYRGLSMRDLLPYLRGEKQGKVFGLTFDDGFRNVLQHALPVLHATGFTATNYFVAGQIDGSNVWDLEKGVPPAKLMNRADILAWAGAGQEVGSHTLDHVDLKHCGATAAQRQIQDSKAVLEDLTGESVDAFCFPYGYYLPEQCAFAQACGYSTATTTRRGRARAGDGLLELPRMSVVRSTHFLSLAIKMFSGREDKRGRA